MSDLTMFNFSAFLLTVSVLFMLLYVVAEEDGRVRIQLQRLFAVALLSMPFNIGGTVFTVFGNAKSDKNIISVFSVYQSAPKGSAFAIVSVGYQYAGEYALNFFGIGYMRAENAGQLLGISYMHARMETFQFAGFSYHRGATVEAGQGIGIAYMKSRNTAMQLFGLAYQQGRDVRQIAGINIQNATMKAKTGAGISLFQKAGTQERVFAVWSELQEPETQ